MKKISVRGIAVSAVMGAIGFVLMVLEFPLPFLIPAFVKFDFSELPALITAFAFGPFYGVLVCLIKNLLHLFVSTSAGVGELSNFLLGAVFTFICGIIYRHHRTRKGALIPSLAGAFAMAAVSLVTNYFVVYPAYVVLYNMPMDAILDMYQLLLPAADTFFKALLIFNFPFTLGKGLVVSILCFLIYKKISPVLKYGKAQKSLK